MKARNEYKNYESYIRENKSELMSEYESLHDDFVRLYDYPSFEDFCIGKWQSLN